MNYQLDILKKLIVKYDRSLTSIGKNKISRKICLLLSKDYPKYLEPTEYELRQKINEAIASLISQGLIDSKPLRNNTYDQITLVLDETAISKSYSIIGKEPKKTVRKRLEEILLECSQSDSDTLCSYATEQLLRLENNSSIEFFNDDFREYINLLKGVYEIQRLKEETFYRNFSMNVYNNSKYFEKHIIHKIENFLYKYGDFEDKDKILEELNLIKTPSCINIKGNVQITFLNGSKIDVNPLLGGIGLSTVDINFIDRIAVHNDGILTVENLTNYYTYHSNEFCTIYLGGFSNHCRRAFLKTIYHNNPSKKYFHFGDIDAGGFYILNHLIKKTGIPFIPYWMDIVTLKKYKKYWETLTNNDILRLHKLLDSPYSETVQFMLDNNCKLEQESII